MKLVLGKLTVDGDALTIFVDGRPVPAPPKVVELLAALCERSGEVISKEMLIERLWPAGYADDATLWQTIYMARKFLAKTDQGSIETHPRRGYRFVPKQTEPQAPNEPSAVRGVSGRWRAVAAVCLAVLVVSCAGYAAIARRVAVRHPNNVAVPSTALRAYNLGRYYLHQRTVASVTRAIAEFGEAERNAKTSAPVYSALSQAELLRAVQIRRNRAEMLGHARDDARAALRMDPQSGDAQTVLAASEFYASLPLRDAGVQTAENIDNSFKRAIALDEDSASAHMYYGQFLFARGDLRDASTQLRRAIDLDPSLGYANVLLAQVAYRMGDPRTAIRYAREGLGFGTADKVDVLQTLGYAYEATGKHQFALRTFRELGRYDPNGSAAGIAFVESRIARLHAI